jgi:integrase
MGATRGDKSTSRPMLYRREGATGVRWVARWREPGERDELGRMKRGDLKAKTFPTRAQAIEFLDGVKTDMARGEYQAPSKLTLREAADEWMDRMDAHGDLRPRTRDLYRRDMDRAVEILGPWVRLVDLTTKAIADLRDTLRAQGLSPTTVKRATQPLRGMLQHYTERGVLRTNPAENLTRMRGATKQTRKARALTDAELTALIRATPEGQGRLLIQFLAGTGLRIGEALAVQWCDVWTDAGLVNVQRQAPETTGGQHTQPKTDNGFRQVPLPPVLAAALTTYREQSRFPGDDDLVFANARGTYHAQNNLMRRLLKPAAEAAGLVEPVEREDGTVVLKAWPGFHALRHSYASRALREGWDLARLSATLGHASIAFTLQRYSHFIPNAALDTSFIDAAIRVD